jgi:HPt (histidine-containing phosphotransfer) domain-containing protein
MDSARAMAAWLNDSQEGESFPEEGSGTRSATIFDPEGAREQLGIDASGFARIFDCIWLEVSERRSLLDEAFKANDLATVALHAHTIKSSAATIGAEALSQAAFAVELAAIARKHDELVAALAAFNTAKETLSKLLGMG